MKRYAYITEPYVSLYQDGMKEYDDDLLCGWAFEITEELEDRVKVTTHYGVSAWLYKGCWREVDEKELKRRDAEGRACIVTKIFADVHEEPNFKSLVVMTLPRGSIIETDGPEEGRYTPVVLPDGRRGYVENAFLKKRPDSDGMLTAPDAKEWLKNQPVPGKPGELQQAAIRTGEQYLGTEYRWGGKAPMGVDCSGFVFMCYMLNGYLLPRCARPVPERNFEPVDFEDLQPGDLIRFNNANHIAISLGGKEYMHSTSRDWAYGVVKSSFDETSPLYLAGMRERVVLCERVVPQACREKDHTRH